MSRTQRTIVMALAIVATMLGGWLIASAWAARDEIAARTKQLERELDDKQRVAANREQYAMQLQDLREMLGVLVQQLPSHLDPQALEKSLRDQAALAGLDIAWLQMSQEQTKEGFYAELRTQLVTECSTAQLLKFLGALQHETPLRQIATLKLEPTTRATALRASITLVSFRIVEEDTE
jgi:Tfp pilus assembly protein PilO